MSKNFMSKNLPELRAFFLFQTPLMKEVMKLVETKLLLDHLSRPRLTTFPRNLLEKTASQISGSLTKPCTLTPRTPARMNEMWISLLLLELEREHFQPFPQMRRRSEG